ncbi:MAG TPA: hypothetical protein VFJ97_03800 [Dermatophilaceae bacterium]|nr:hypothetical protein [Dermatophilaceae bacterium]
MDVVYDLVVLTHLLGMAAIVGGYLAVRAAPRVSSWMLWGARMQVLSGVVLVGLAEGVDSLDKNLDMAKITVKLVIALAVVAAAEIWSGRTRRTGAGPTLLPHVVGLGAVLNAAVAVLWH